MQPTEIEYDITLRVTIPTLEAGRSADAPAPFFEEFYASCPGTVKVLRAQRITPAVNYGGPR
jgi:hypothetical protein